MGWLAFSVFAGTMGAIILASYRERRRQQRGEHHQCVVCGYDLRATPECCPECGHRPADDPVTGPLDAHKLRDDWPANPIDMRDPEPGESPVVMHATDNFMEADLVTQQLEARGVRCRQRSTRAGGGRGVSELYTGQRSTTARVVVWSGDAERAAAYLRSVSLEAAPAALDPHEQAE